ncbi:PSP1 domain protein [Spirochaeta thermophila DSM 6578]|uniref:PSP1 domain protein n=1 Tax=Winmispira thermophila (strain ATCC 700085 / DSM 6578 / Z-1203) TaxID=869211 RepID=G0GD87_WINT7|nr:regulatory iron-sulfur-containing complex subunit RicT [Spirochaeta thermophila]AEJ62162.1 PSP1 domain protein [Spirochaeta thermophila DSM 6578]
MNEQQSPCASCGGCEPHTEGSPAAWVVKVVHTSETEICREPQGWTPLPGDHVIVESKYGKDLGKVLGPVRDISRFLQGRKPEEVLRRIHRKATAEDIERYEHLKGEEDRAFRICIQKIEEHRLDMKLVSVHYLTDEPKILFFFTAEGRVDFRALVRDLVAIFKKRIELRQIGVRDETRLLGGVGICGRGLCCHAVTDHLVPVSIRMAKAQNLSLNSMKISGPCGRLLCCLAYEAETYEVERAHFPPENTRLRYEGAHYKVLEVNILTRQVILAGPEGQRLVLPEEAFVRDEDGKTWSFKEGALSSLD